LFSNLLFQLCRQTSNSNFDILPFCMLIVTFDMDSFTFLNLRHRKNQNINFFNFFGHSYLLLLLINWDLSYHYYSLPWALVEYYLKIFETKYLRLPQEFIVDVRYRLLTQKVPNKYKFYWIVVFIHGIKGPVLGWIINSQFIILMSKMQNETNSKSSSTGSVDLTKWIDARSLNRFNIDYWWYSS